MGVDRNLSTEMFIMILHHCMLFVYIAVTDSHHAGSHLQIADWTSFTSVLLINQFVHNMIL